jgi:hypothetical protein
MPREGCPMSALSEKNLQQRVRHIRSMYECLDEFPNVFENFVFPVAIYDRDGKAIIANNCFRSLTIISNCDVKQGSANIFDCLNNEEAGIIEAARKAFDGNAEVVQNFVCPLIPDSEASKITLSLFKGAVFFPIAYLVGKIHYCAVLLVRDANFGDDE